MGPRACAILLLASCHSGPAPAPPAEEAEEHVFELVSQPADAQSARAIEGMLGRGRRAVEAFFGTTFRAPVVVSVLPDRSAFTAWFPEEWGMGETACWMVAVGVDERIAILSPRVWGTDACEHDGQDADHVRDVVVHELVHTFHGQHNPTHDFVGAESLGWFLEGLATYASGQLERGHRDRAREAVATGAGPESLATAWSGPYRYGVCGTLVEYLDLTFGRAALCEMLAMTREEELLSLVGVTEEELLAGWRSAVRRE